MTITVQNKTSRGAIAVIYTFFYTPGPPVVGGADELNMGVVPCKHQSKILANENFNLSN